MPKITCKRCGGTGLRFPKRTPDGKPNPLYSVGARCVPCGGMGWKKE